MFFRALHDVYGVSALTISFCRAGLACAILVVTLAMARPASLKIPPRAFAFFAIYGFLGVAAFYFLYVHAVIATTVTTAVVLLYTAPVFVTLMAWRAWGEPLNARKLLALALAFCGAALVVRAYEPAQLSLNVAGVALGLGAGFTYALYTVISKFALARYASWTALTYALLFGSLFLAPLQTPAGFAPLLQQPAAWIFLLGLAIGPTLGSYALYNAGLQHVPASNASLVATIEPVVASVLAFVFLAERLEVWQVMGGVMVVVGAVISRQ